MAKGLTRERLIRAALEIVDREGLNALSMRKLGAELGVDPMAAYRHLPNKSALLDGVMEAVHAEVDLDIDESQPWQDQLRQLASANLNALLAHPNAAPLLAQRPTRTVGSLLLVERAFEIMSRAGVPLYYAGLTVNNLGLLTTSIALAMSSDSSIPEENEETGKLYEELPADQLPLVVEAFRTGQLATGFDEVLEFALDAIISRLEAVRTPPPLPA